jgi:hypothetical protein
MPKLLVAVAALLIASLQAWDAHALGAERSVRVIIAVGVLLPAVAILLTRDVRVRGAAVVVAATLMVLARFVSAQPMPALALAAFFPATLILLDHIKSLASQRAALEDRARKG